MNARTIIEAETPKKVFQKAQPIYKVHHPTGTTEWRCAGCGQLVITPGSEEPSPKRWSDGHVCQHWVKVQVNEAEDPKKTFRSLPSTVIEPGDEYWLNVAKADEPWENGEFCPTLIAKRNEMRTLDGLYGLSNIVSDAVGYRGDMDDVHEDDYENGMEQYEAPMYDDVRRGVTSGQVNGVAGPIKWRLVYHEKPRWVAGQQSRSWNPQNVVQVEPGKRYGKAYDAAKSPKVFRSLFDLPEEPG